MADATGTCFSLLAYELIRENRKVTPQQMKAVKAPVQKAPAQPEDFKPDRASLRASRHEAATELAWLTRSGRQAAPGHRAVSRASGWRRRFDSSSLLPRRAREHVQACTTTGCSPPHIPLTPTLSPKGRGGQVSYCARLWPTGLCTKTVGWALPTTTCTCGGRSPPYIRGCRSPKQAVLAKPAKGDASLRSA